MNRSEEETMLVVYMAHPVSGDVEANLNAARRWLKWLLDHCPQHSIIAPWITLCEILDNGADYFLSLQRDCAVVERCDEIWLVGSTISNGMSIEVMAHDMKYMPTVRDLTGSVEPPEFFSLPQAKFAYEAVKVN